MFIALAKELGIQNQMDNVDDKYWMKFFEYEIFISDLTYCSASQRKFPLLKTVTQMSGHQHG